MSTQTRKRGFVAAQPQATAAGPSASALAVSELQRVNSQVDAWYAAHEGEATIPAEVKAELDALGYARARDRVFATPALTPQDLAAKIATIWELSSDIEWHPARDDHREIVAKGSDADHALLACYLDAMSLSGTVPNLSAVPTDFSALIEELRAAALHWGKEADRTDEVKAEKEGRRVTAKDERIWSAASERHHSALSAMIDYRPTSAQEMALKAGVITENSDSYFRAVEYDFARIYQRDADHLARIEANSQVIAGAIPIPTGAQQAWDQAFSAWREASASHTRNCEDVREWSEREHASLARCFETRDVLLSMFAPDGPALAQKLMVLAYVAEDFGFCFEEDDPAFIREKGAAADVALLNCIENARALGAMNAAATAATAEGLALYAERRRVDVDEADPSPWAAREDAWFEAVEGLPLTPENAGVRALAFTLLNGDLYSDEANPAFDTRIVRQIVATEGAAPPFDVAAWLETFRSQTDATLAANAGGELWASQIWGETPPTEGGMAKAQELVEALTPWERKSVIAHLSREGGR